MTRAEIERLRAEIRSDRAAFSARVAELEQVDLRAPEAAHLAQVAVALHHAYGAIEAALARVARLLEGSLPQGSDWHQQLLQTMALEIQTVRPAILSEESSLALRKLLAFRHFFRHAYSVDWDREQLAALRDTALGLRAPLGRDLDALDAFLASLAAAVAS